MKHIPEIVRFPQPRLLVDGEPFLILGLQWDCNSCYTDLEMLALFKEAAHLGANTAVTPLYWELVEPAPGEFDFSKVDAQIQACRENGLRLIILWFAGYKNATCCYAPPYIRDDHTAFQKIVRADGTLQTRTLCPNGTSALERDQGAFQLLMHHLLEVDEEERTVIMVQVENESGVIGGTDRCYCAVCNEKFGERDWEHRYGARAGEAFSAYSVARYVNTVAAAGKKVYPIPMYTNAWLGGGPAERPGLDYPSGGPVARWLPIWREAAPSLDLIAPDIYGPSYPTFNKTCGEFTVESNPLYIAECASDIRSKTERNVFYAIGIHAAIGFTPWAIDRTFPNWFDVPLVRRFDLAKGPGARPLHDSYTAIKRAMKQVAEAAGTDRIVTFVQETGDVRTAFHLDGVDFLVTYPDPDGTSRGMVITLGNREFLVLGCAYQIQLFRPAPDCTPLEVLFLERGYYEGEEWIRTAKVTRETANGEKPLKVEDATVLRVRIEQ
ncbi:MAG: hypothetical protein JWN30_1494 [Bacilli bacterium]|nr:hypothetical protein [Bacilli bacterium]